MLCNAHYETKIFNNLHLLIISILFVTFLIRGSYNDWYDAIALILSRSRNARHWFARNILLSHPHRLAEYLLECPVGEVWTSLIVSDISKFIYQIS